MVVYEWFKLQAFEWENVGVLDRCSLLGAVRLREVVARGEKSLYMDIKSDHASYSRDVSLSLICS